MAGDERQLVEAPALEQLKGLGWSHLDGTTLVPGTSNHRSSLKDVVLTPNLEQAIQRINPWISEDNLRKVVREVTLIQSATLMEANKWLWERLTQYFSVDQDLGSGRRGQTLKLIDFDNLQNNEFLCIDQFKIQGPSQNIIPDILLFVNGLPLGVIECKALCHRSDGGGDQPTTPLRQPQKSKRHRGLRETLSLQPSDGLHL
jgi:type I restriction enzyme, R subunit